MKRQRTVKRAQLPGKRVRDRKGGPSPYCAAWRRLRLVVLYAEPWCRMCGALARDVDHITPIRIRPDLRLERDNLQPLCVACHRGPKAAADNAKYGKE